MNIYHVENVLLLSIVRGFLVNGREQQFVACEAVHGRYQQIRQFEPVALFLSLRPLSNTPKVENKRHVNVSSKGQNISTFSCKVVR